MGADFTRSARRLGLAAAVGVVLFEAAYLACLVIGLATLPSPVDPIGDPWFTALELLILAMMPFMVGLMVAVYAWADEDRKVVGMVAVLFMALVAVVTSAVHFAILVLSRRPPFADMDWLFSFSWPSVVYALDILAWDVFFPISVLFAAAVFRGDGLEARIRILLVVSGVVAFAGLAGVVTNDMQIRNIGILGYAVVFPVAAALVGILFRRSGLPDRDPRSSQITEPGDSHGPTPGHGPAWPIPPTTGESR